ncbi:hypothetical protein, conserved [Eimeria tenella]|uniref:Uncharacterized protein n=1 Tax=Eimeria tenella TaxID=5802 RepID=U6KH92_EIMTE|nr:hypothetical protein, conserved [Eimeria tenella]CDJ37365.1 hypothetical protein, conserved [Eimeria tenella]|eukprot:XP_013228203.1 hypothetical protein, conserved [Eimeria tenella]
MLKAASAGLLWVRSWRPRLRVIESCGQSCCFSSSQQSVGTLLAEKKGNKLKINSEKELFEEAVGAECPAHDAGANDSQRGEEEAAAAAAAAAAAPSAPAAAPAAESAAAEDDWIYEAKPGGRLHFEAHKRLMMLASSPAAAAAAGNPPSAAAAAAGSPPSAAAAAAAAAGPGEPLNIWGVPLVRYLPAAERQQQQQCELGLLVRRQCMQAAAEFGSAAERFGVYRHLREPAAEPQDAALAASFKSAEMKSYLLFLAPHLPSLELQWVISGFLSVHLRHMDQQQMQHLLQLLQLQERPPAAATAAAAAGSQASAKCSCGQTRCCWGRHRVKGNSSSCSKINSHTSSNSSSSSSGTGSHGSGTDSDSPCSDNSSSSSSSGSCCCDGLTAATLADLLRCRGPRCVPPCLRGNSALRPLFSFINSNHPLLPFLPPPGALPPD